MIGYEYNDGGRKAAGYKGHARDCVTRAYCIVTGTDYKKAYKIFAQAQADAGFAKSANNGINRKVSRALFPKMGLTKVKLGRGKRPTFTEAYEQYGNCIVSTTKHLAALVDGKLHDIRDCRTYTWENEWGGDEIRERKAMSIWVP